MGQAGYSTAYILNSFSYHLMLRRLLTLEYPTVPLNPNGVDVRCPKQAIDNGVQGAPLPLLYESKFPSPALWSSNKLKLAE